MDVTYEALRVSSATANGFTQRLYTSSLLFTYCSDFVFALGHLLFEFSGISILGISHLVCCPLLIWGTPFSVLGFGFTFGVLGVCPLLFALPARPLCWAKRGEEESGGKRAGNFTKSGGGINMRRTKFPRSRTGRR